MAVLDELREHARVCVIRLRSLGDCVLTTPALAMLKRYRPDLRVGIAVEDAFAAVLEGSPAVDEILKPSWRVIRKWRPDLCVNLHGGTRSQWMTALSGAKWRAGFAHHSTTIAYNLKIPYTQPNILLRHLLHWVYLPVMCRVRNFLPAFRPSLAGTPCCIPMPRRQKNNGPLKSFVK